MICIIFPHYFLSQLPFFVSWLYFTHCSLLIMNYFSIGRNFSWGSLKILIAFPYYYILFPVNIFPFVFFCDCHDFLFIDIIVCPLLFSLHSSCTIFFTIMFFSLHVSLFFHYELLILKETSLQFPQILIYSYVFHK
jgi:hypothetical protein